MSKRTRPAIFEIVREMINSVGVTAPPIPVERIARLHDAVIRYVPFEGKISGLLYREGEQVVIGVNRLHPKPRQRFTIAHELGHLVLHSEEIFHFDRDFAVVWRNKKSSEATDRNEIEANTFAAELLMPTEMILGDLEGHPLDYENDEMIRKFASRYQVSLQAMILRLTKLNLLNPVDGTDM